jgi:hypothetical protein
MLTASAGPGHRRRATAVMATIPSRADIVERAVSSIYAQVDELRVVFNDYERIPGWAAEDEKIIPLLNRPDRYSSAAVWLHLDDVDGYVFVVDDDLVYPAEYVQVMRARLEALELAAVVTAFGVLLKEPFFDYLADRTVITLTTELTIDTRVHLGGVGCCAFHTDTLRPRIADFPDLHSRDPWFAIKAARHGVPIICIARPRCWIEKSGPTPFSIFTLVRDDPALRRRKNVVIRDVLLPLIRGLGDL